LLRSSAMISQYFMRRDCAFFWSGAARGIVEIP
jgi:hypothetical protein